MVINTALLFPYQNHLVFEDNYTQLGFLESLINLLHLNQLSRILRQSHFPFELRHLFGIGIQSLLKPLNIVNFDLLQFIKKLLIVVMIPDTSETFLDQIVDLVDHLLILL